MTGINEIVNFLTSSTILTFYKVLGGIIAILLLMSAIVRLLISHIADKHYRFIISKIINAIGYTVIIGWIFFHIYNSNSDIAVAIGVVGAGMAFALQEVIASFAGWLAIILGDFYKAGDRVQLGGIKGDILDIGVLRTTVMEIGEWVNGDQYNGRIVRVANSFVFKEPVYNYSANISFLWDELTITIKYGSDYDQLKLILLDAAKSVTEGYIHSNKETWNNMTAKYIIDESQIDPQVLIQMLPYALECSVRYITPYHDRRITKDKIFRRILEDVSKYPSIMLMGAPTSININAAQSHNTQQ